jgi:hypothetical protein
MQNFFLKSSRLKTAQELEDEKKIKEQRKAEKEAKKLKQLEE